MDPIYEAYNDALSEAVTIDKNRYYLAKPPMKKGDKPRIPGLPRTKGFSTRDQATRYKNSDTSGRLVHMIVVKGSEVLSEAYARANAYDATVDRAIKVDMPKRKLQPWENEIVQGILKTLDGVKNKRKATKKVIGYLSAMGRPWTYMEDPKGRETLYIYDKAGKQIMQIN